MSREVLLEQFQPVRKRLFSDTPDAGIRLAAFGVRVRRFFPKRELDMFDPARAVVMPARVPLHVLGFEVGHVQEPVEVGVHKLHRGSLIREQFIPHLFTRRDHAVPDDALRLFQLGAQVFKRLALDRAVPPEHARAGRRMPARFALARERSLPRDVVHEVAVGRELRELLVVRFRLIRILAHAPRVVDMVAREPCPLLHVRQPLFALHARRRACLSKRHEHDDVC